MSEKQTEERIMSEKQTFLKDAPYEFIPLLKTARQTDYNEQSIREKCIYSGRLQLKITVKSPLHVGGGLPEYDNNGNVIKKLMRRNERVIIPGSSLKGAVRAVAEAVSYSCAVKVPNQVLQPVLPPGNNQSCESMSKLCMSCYIFGMMSKTESCKGKVLFGEFVMESGKLIKEKIPELKSPFQDYPKRENQDTFKRDGYGNERLYYCKACNTGNCENCTKENYYQKRDMAGKDREMEFRGRKFYSTGKERMPDNGEKTCYEMIAPGSVLKGEIIFQNLRQEEGRLLAYALNIRHFFCTKLGYGKPLGYGKAEIALESVQGMGDRYPSMAKADRKLIERWASQYRTENTDEIKSAVNELERIMSNEERSNIAGGY